MSEVWFLAAILIRIALIAVLLAIKLHISTALSEIIVGTVAQLNVGARGGASIVTFAILAWPTPSFFKRYSNHISELEAKYILRLLFGVGGPATRAGSEAVLPTSIIGIVLASTVGKDHLLIRRLRKLTFGVLTPFYFIVLFLAKSLTKFVGVFPVTKYFRYGRQENVYTTLLMSTGLTFVTISALFGLSHNIITQAQYSHLVAAVIASALILPVVANDFFLPHHLLPKKIEETGRETIAAGEAL